MVMATGFDHDPYMPEWPGRDEFEGTLMHAAEFRNPEPFQGLDVLVVGPGNTGSEIATFLADGGAAACGPRCARRRTSSRATGSGCR